MFWWSLADVAGWVEQPWRGHLAGLGVGFEGQGDGPGRLAVQERERIGGRVAVEADGGRQVWLLASGVSPADRAASMSELLTGQDRQALSGVLERFAVRLLATRSDPDGRLVASGARPCPLVVVPLLGSGQGGFGSRLRSHAAWLLGQLHRLAVDARVDVVLVVHGAERRASAYEALLRQERSRIGLIPDVA